MGKREFACIWAKHPTCGHDICVFCSESRGDVSETKCTVSACEEFSPTDLGPTIPIPELPPALKRYLDQIDRTSQSPIERAVEFLPKNLRETPAADITRAIMAALLQANPEWRR